MSEEIRNYTLQYGPFDWSIFYKDTRARNCLMNAFTNAGQAPSLIDVCDFFERFKGSSDFLKLENLGLSSFFLIGNRIYKKYGVDIRSPYTITFVNKKEGEIKMNNWDTSNNNGTIISKSREVPFFVEALYLVEARYILKCLEFNKGNIAATANGLHISYASLTAKIRDMRLSGIPVPERTAQKPKNLEDRKTILARLKHTL